MSLVMQIFIDQQQSSKTHINAYVANGGWVPRSQGAGTANPNPGR